MKKIFLIILITILSASTVNSQISNKNFIDQPYIEVVGTFEQEIIPDEIYLKITLDENDSKGKLSLEKQEQMLIDKLKTLNINLDKNFSILDFEGQYKRHFLKDNEILKTKSYQLIAHNGSQLGLIYKALDEIEISKVSITKISHSNIEELRRQTKIEALKIAKIKANEYANAIDQKIGKAIFIKEIPQQHYLYQNNLQIANEVITPNSRADSKIENLNFETINLKMSVEAKFILY